MVFRKTVRLMENMKYDSMENEMHCAESERPYCQYTVTYSTLIDGHL